MKWVYHSAAEFSADHALTLYLGEREDSHNHVWRVAVEVGADRLQPEHFALDFHAVHNALRSVVNPLDGTNLNQHPRIGLPSPTAERVAEVLAEDLGGLLAGFGGELLKVSVWEGPENRVDLVF
jgi:6-pyruvoyl-tetrahydropterin synthase